MKGRIGAVTIVYDEGPRFYGPPELVGPIEKAALRALARDPYTNACIELKQFVLGRRGVIEHDCTPEDLCHGGEGPAGC